MFLGIPALAAVEILLPENMGKTHNQNGGKRCGNFEYKNVIKNREGAGLRCSRS